MFLSSCKNLGLGAELLFFCDLLQMWPIFIGSVDNFGTSLSDALILASTDPQYDDRLFNSLNYEFRTCCVHKLLFVLTFRTIYVHNMFSTCSELGIFMY